MLYLYYNDNKEPPQSYSYIIRPLYAAVRVQRFKPFLELRVSGVVP